MTSPEATGFRRWVADAGTIAGTIAGSVGIIYLLGGAVVWLRFWKAGVPPDQGVALMSNQQLLVIGLRLIVLPAVVAAVLVVILTAVWDKASASGRRWVLAGLVGLVLLLVLVGVPWRFSMARWPVSLGFILAALAAATGVGLAVAAASSGTLRWAAIGLGLLVTAGASVWFSLGPELRRDPSVLLRLIVVVLLWSVVLGLIVVLIRLMSMPAAEAEWPNGSRLAGLVLAVAVLAVLLALPASIASITWPVGLALASIAAWYLRRERNAWLAMAVVGAAAVISLGRQIDEPVQLLRTSVALKDPTDVLQGVYINGTGDTVYIGDVDHGEVLGIPRSRIVSIAVGPPEERAPEPSLLSHLVPGKARFAVRPLQVWCNGQSYTWTEPRRYCRTQPRLYWRKDEDHRKLDRLGIPVRLQCPPLAREGCRGWLLLRTKDRYDFGPDAAPRPARFEPVRFVAGRNRKIEVCVPITESRLQLLREKHPTGDVDFIARLTLDQGGETEFRREPYGLRVGAAEVAQVPMLYSDCEPELDVVTAVSQRTLTVSVHAHPRANAPSVRPRRSEGFVRFCLRHRKTAAVKRAKVELRRGRAVLKRTLKPGRWDLDVRYTSVAGDDYARPDATTTLRILSAGRRSS
jgi:hypothetical protein